jgi:hypothetical protein
VEEALREHIYAYLDLYVRKRCFSRADWQQIFDRFDKSVADHLPPNKAELIVSWRVHPAPEGNALGFLFTPDWAPYERFEKIVISRSENALDCGFQGRISPCSVEQCVLESVKKKNPFRAIFGSQGVDGLTAHAIIGRNDGTGTVLRWDGRADRVSEQPCRFEIGHSIHGGEHVDCKMP